MKSKSLSFGKIKCLSEYINPTASESTSPVNIVTSEKLVATLLNCLTNNTFPDISHYGGGMMLTPNSNGEGGFLGMHVDAAIHGRHEDWKREYSAILCISEEYDSSFDCLLHDGNNHIRLPYKFNRLNIFKCAENSWHGFPEITKGLDRKTLGVMYWSKLSEEDKTKEFVKAKFNNNLDFS